MFKLSHISLGLATLILLGSSCASLDKTVSTFGNAFKGNTKKDASTYTLDDKKKYKKFQSNKKYNEKNSETEIIRRMDADDARNGIEKPKVKKDKKKIDDRNFIQKIFKVGE